jgi:hypothetical protein
MRETRKGCKLVGKPEDKGTWGELGAYGWIILNGP